MFYKKVFANLADFHPWLWAEADQNTLCPWQLYETAFRKLQLLGTKHSILFLCIESHMEELDLSKKNSN